MTLAAAGRERELEPPAGLDADRERGGHGREQVLAQVRLCEVDIKVDQAPARAARVDLDAGGVL